MERQKGIFALLESTFKLIYGPDELRDIAARLDIELRPWTEPQLRANLSILKDVDVILSGWGAPRLDTEFLSAAPKLKALFYGAGSASGVVTREAWDRGVKITSAYAANAVPVAEYTLAMILFCLKHGFRYAREMREMQGRPRGGVTPGAYGSRVGLISMGVIGRHLLALLKHFDLRVSIYDPFVSREEAEHLGVELISLEQIFKTCDVVSLHTPLLDETRGMITGAHIATMKPGASFLNTARGGLMREEEVIQVLQKRPDIQVVLDVTEPEPPVKGSLFYTLPNVILTPHIAGSKDSECHRMGRAMVEELDRYLAGQPLKWAVTPELAKHSSHRPSGA